MIQCIKYVLFDEFILVSLRIEWTEQSIYTKILYNFISKDFRNDFHISKRRLCLARRESEVKTFLWNAI